MLKVNNKDTRPTLDVLAPYSSVSIVNFKQVIAGWVCSFHILYNFPLETLDGVGRVLEALNIKNVRHKNLNSEAKIFIYENLQNEAAVIKIDLSWYFTDCFTALFI